MNLLNAISRIAPLVAGASEQWEDAIEHLREGAEGLDDESPEYSYPVVDKRFEAATVRYRPSKRRKALGLPGRVKRTRYRPVDLRKRRVVLVLHQAGVVISRASLERRRAKKITGHEAWSTDGTVFLIHPDETRLVAANRLDRDPFHAINIEVVGNFAGVEGEGRFFQPERFGRSVITPEFSAFAKQRLTDRIVGLRAIGIEPYMLAPHRVAGRDENGNPNRQICCASGLWGIAEEVAAELAVPVPDDDYAIGGLPIPKSWRTDAYAHCMKVAA